MSKKNAKDQTTRNTRNSIGEAFIFLGEDNNNYVTFLGVGTVCRVEKGEKVDRVLMHFGLNLRPLYVVNNHARRQIFSLKKGQLATVIGTYKVFTLPSGKKTTRLFANGFQAWYVPKMLDIKNYDTNELEKLEQEQENDLTNFLDEIAKGDIA